MFVIFAYEDINYLTGKYTSLCDLTSATYRPEIIKKKKRINSRDFIMSVLKKILAIFANIHQHSHTANFKKPRDCDRMDRLVHPSNLFPSNQLAI
ncbi:hypothetical protein TNCT_63481 [Trichonephila clavata]|uniref:Uncharacterized protein n=1 Tax=Trichonephila clavata TaxID=2740835 RepID=A0A8X6LFT2_TRICU|nr:hypothetical protein TNCT_63481 [Trichonephila clavata]